MQSMAFRDSKNKNSRTVSRGISILNSLKINIFRRNFKNAYALKILDCAEFYKAGKIKSELR